MFPFSSEGSQDLRTAVRQFRRTPALSAIVILTLALCIGATTAVYGVVRHLLIAPLPYPDGNRIVSLEARKDGEGDFRWDIDAALYRLWATRSRTLEDFATYTWGTYSLGDGLERDSVKGGLVSASFLPMLRIRPSLGRGFTAEDEYRGAQPVVLLGERLWRRRFGGAPDVTARFITLNGLRRSIVGVVPANVSVPDQREEPPDIWLPMASDYVSGVAGFARLRPGITSTAASRELDALLHTFPQTDWYAGRRAEVRTALDRVEPQRRRAVQVLFAAAVGLLLIACADVAGLLLMRGWARRRELAIRQVLGAGRARLARQLLTESMLLAVPSGVLGLLVAWIGMRPAALGYFGAVRIDTAALLWTATVSMATMLLFGVGPALLAGERSLDGALRSGGGTGSSRATRRVHASLVVGQIALSLAFLAAAGVLARSFVALVGAPVGYEAKGLFEVSVRGATAATMPTLHEMLVATPGITEVAIGTLPMTHIDEFPAVVEGAAGLRPSGVGNTAKAYVSPEYFRVARVPLVRGREFDASSAAAGEVVINQTLARLVWPDGDAVGRRLRLGKTKWVTVVGIAGDVLMPGGRAPEFFKLQMYQPVDASEPEGSFVLRARGDPAALRRVLSTTIARAGVGAALENVVAAESTLEYAYRGPRVALSLFGAFALLAVALAAVGLFGIVAFAVARRTREIGIRMALGADAATLTRAVLSQSMRLVLVGCAIGLVGAFGAARALTALVYDVSPTDPTALGGAVALLVMVALSASAVPLRRALRVDPVDTLRAE